MTRLKREDKEKLQESEGQHDLHTEGPIAEKDEVKKAEDRTADNHAHDIADSEKLKDDEGHQVRETEKE